MNHNPEIFSRWASLPVHFIYFRYFKNISANFLELRQFLLNHQSIQKVSKWAGLTTMFRRITSLFPVIQPVRSYLSVSNSFGSGLIWFWSGFMSKLNDYCLVFFWQGKKIWIWKSQDLKQNQNIYFWGYGRLSRTDGPAEVKTEVRKRKYV